MAKALIYYLLASTGVFFQHNIQYIYPWWRDKYLLTALIFSIPIGFSYLKAWTYFVDATGSVWTTRFIFFGLSYLVFPLTAYFFIGESPLTLKTLICTLLSILIILVQYKM
jgi:hypothetical protein